MANVKRHQLNERKVRSAAPGVHVDGQGLHLRVAPTGTRNWILRLTVDGKRRNFGLGGFPDVSLKEARSRAAGMRRRVREGHEPVIKPRKAVKVEPAVPTFQAAAIRVIDNRAPTWSSRKHAENWYNTLRLHAFPVIGKMPIDAIGTADILATLEPIWTAKPETATRVKQRMATVFDYAIAAEWRTDNPCNGALKAALPPRSRVRRHHPALPYDEVADALQAIRGTRGHYSPKLGLAFVILTAARTGEVMQATWDEIDESERLWTRPASHMKMRKAHRVPLSQGAMNILGAAKEVSTGTGPIFPSNRKPNQPLSNMAFEMCLRRAGYEHVTVHGFRASFRTWALEQTDTPWAVAEAALAHSLGGQEVVAYARSDLFERRRTLMAEWWNFVNVQARHPVLTQ